MGCTACPFVKRVDKEQFEENPKVLAHHLKVVRDYVMPPKKKEERRKIEKKTVGNSSREEQKQTAAAAWLMGQSIPESNNSSIMPHLFQALFGPSHAGTVVAYGNNENEVFVEHQGQIRCVRLE
jgi:hypothetical protein